MDIIAYFKNYLPLLDLHNYFNIEAFFFLLLQIVIDITKAFLLKVEHSLVIGLLIIDIKAFFFKIYALGIRFFRVCSQLIKAVDNIVLDSVLVNYVKENFCDIDDIGFRFFRKCISVNRDGNIHLNSLFYFIFIYRYSCNIVHAL